MATKRYQIWNKIDDIYTIGPNPATGECFFTAQEWANKHSWIKAPGAKMIIGKGIINGTHAMEFEKTVESYVRNGLVLQENMTDEEILEAIEYFEDHPPVDETITNEERIAAALEAQVMMMDTAELSLEEQQKESNVPSPAYTRIKNNYNRGLWNKTLVNIAAATGRITKQEANEIIGE